MFGNLGTLMSLMKDAPRLAQEAKQMQERMAAERFIGEAGAGQVRATFDGKSELLEVKFDPALVQSGDVEMLEELTLAAVRDGQQKAREAMQKEMQSLMGGLDLGGMMNMLGGGPK